MKKEREMGESDRGWDGGSLQNMSGTQPNREENERVTSMQHPKRFTTMIAGSALR